MKAKLSVIIPVYNTEKYLERALDSVVNQTYKNLEIIIVDDGSTDHSEDIYRRYATNDPRIIIYKEPNSGVSYARNTGLALMSGDYITFFDSDDWLDKEAYMEMIQTMEASDADIVTCGYQIEGEMKNYIKAKYNVTKTEKRLSTEMLSDMLLDRQSAYSFNKVYKKDIILDHKIYFNTQLAVLEDFDFLVRLCFLKPQIVCMDKAFYHYAIRSDSLSKSPANDKKLTMKDATQLILKNIRNYHPELLSQAAVFFYNTNIGLLEEFYSAPQMNVSSMEQLKACIKEVGLLDCVNKKIRLKVRMALYFPFLFHFVKRVTKLKNDLLYGGNQ